MGKFWRYIQRGLNTLLPSRAKYGDDAVTKDGTFYTVDENKNLVEMAKAKDLDTRVPVARVSYALPTTNGAWIRIAESPADIARPNALFRLFWTVSGNHGSALVEAAMNYGNARFSLNQLGYASHSSTATITQVRLVYHTTYTGNRAYLEVYKVGTQAAVLTVEAMNSRGWTLLSAVTTGEIPAGYTSVCSSPRKSASLDCC